MKKVMQLWRTVPGHSIKGNGGESYGVNLTPRNFTYKNKLGFDTSIPNLYFCSAASSYPGFGGTALCEKLTGGYLS